ncbi:glycoside hydrolase family 25 protein [Paenibacillus sp. WLX1005]|uniref:glycoside hydrolase family 25 protein n=1 Tax=Paenibacillus sp. WLX1005 TaxID=3243766 RepID=UPI00398457EC
MQAGQTGNAQGIDVSHYQGAIDWHKVKAAGKAFVFVKASEGSASQDENFSSNVQGARAAGLLVGAYHFLTATSTAAAQAEAAHFVSVVQAVGALELPLVMDYENNPSNVDRATINAIALAFLQDVERLSGRKPLVYTGNAFGQNFDASLGTYNLWIARYSDGVPPEDTTAWKQWNFWQYSDAGQVDGISGKVDLNQFQGGLELLQQYASASSKSPDAAHPQSFAQQSAASASSSSSPTAAAQPVPTTVNYIHNGQTVHAAGLLIANEDYVPLRELQSVFGFAVGFDAATKTATVDGHPLQDGRLIGDTTYVQAASLVTAFHGNLVWDHTSKSLTVRQ